MASARSRVRTEHGPRRVDLSRSHVVGLREFVTGNRLVKPTEGPFYVVAGVTTCHGRRAGPLRTFARGPGQRRWHRPRPGRGKAVGLRYDRRATRTELDLAQEEPDK